MRAAHAHTPEVGRRGCLFASFGTLCILLHRMVRVRQIVCFQRLHPVWLAIRLSFRLPSLRTVRASHSILHGPVLFDHVLQFGVFRLLVTAFWDIGVSTGKVTVASIMLPSSLNTLAACMHLCTFIRTRTCALAQTLHCITFARVQAPDA